MGTLELMYLNLSKSVQNLSIFVYHVRKLGSEFDFKALFLSNVMNK